MTYRVFFTTGQYYSANEGATLEQAIRICRRAGFQSRIDDSKGNPLGTWCPSVGYRGL